MKPYFAIGLLALGCSHPDPKTISRLHSRPQDPIATRIVDSARDQMTWGTGYDPAYYHIPYPNGDLSRTKGVCTDVVVRSLRSAGYDLQKLVHEDMNAAWSAYPRYPGRDSPDPNIDHRRVPNQHTYFKRHWKTCPISAGNPTDWKPGDVIEWKLLSGHDHTGVLTDSTRTGSHWSSTTSATVRKRRM